MVDPIWKLVLGLFSGVIFGFLLQKAWVAKQRVIVGAFLLRDMTAYKVLLTAAAVGAVGVWGLHAMGVGEIEPKPLYFGGIVVGGLLFGFGMVLFGYCPGTGVAAAGEGHKDAAVGIGGMLTGAGVYVAAYPQLDPLIRGFGQWGKVTLPSITGISAAFWVPLFVLTVFGVFVAGERFAKDKLRAGPPLPSDRYEDGAA